MINVNIINKSDNKLPEYKHNGDAGMDVRANITKEWLIENNLDITESNEILLKPNERILIPTGLYFQLPFGFEMQIRPRSGLALKNGITVLNSPGTLDFSYNNELKIILINHSNANFIINHGDRICQIVFNKFEEATLNQVNDFENISDRGGFGSTGVK